MGPPPLIFVRLGLLRALAPSGPGPRRAPARSGPGPEGPQSRREAPNPRRTKMRGGGPTYPILGNYPFKLSLAQPQLVCIQSPWHLFYFTQEILTKIDKKKWGTVVVYKICRMCMIVIGINWQSIDAL